MHQSGYINKALVYYSQSLTQGGDVSHNGMRRKALEAIELIIREKVELEEHQCHEDTKLREEGLLSAVSPYQ